MNDAVRTSANRPEVLIALAAACALLTGAGAAAGQTVTLDQAVREGLAESPAIRQAEAASVAASAGRWEAWGRFLPSARFGTSLFENDRLQRTATDPITGGIVNLPDSLIARRLSYGTRATFDADWTVFDPAGMMSIRAARAEAAGAGHTLRGARARIAAEVTLAYLQALEAGAVLEWRRADVHRAAELRRLAEGRFDVGEVPEVDVLQARLAEGDAELALIEAEGTAEAARLALLEHLGARAGGGLELVEPQLPEGSRLPSEETLRRLVLEESAELAALRADRSVAVSNRRAHQAQMLLPSLSLGATRYRSEFGPTREAMTLDPRNEETYYGVSLSWSPLFQPGRRMAERQRTAAAVSGAEARMASLRGALTRELETALATLRRADLLRQRSELNLELAARQREQAAERYRVGVAPLVERLQAEGLAREAERQAIAARYAPLRALAELQRLSGSDLIPLHDDR
jgi:outer membrane protein, multidrug efflux system